MPFAYPHVILTDPIEAISSDRSISLLRRCSLHWITRSTQLLQTSGRNRRANNHPLKSLKANLQTAGHVGKSSRGGEYGPFYVSGIRNRSFDTARQSDNVQAHRRLERVPEPFKVWFRNPLGSGAHTYQSRVFRSLRHVGNAMRDLPSNSTVPWQVSRRLRRPNTGGLAESHCNVAMDSSQSLTASNSIVRIHIPSRGRRS